MLNWENTDQFGNLKAAASSACTLDDLQPDLADMVAAVLADSPSNPRFSVDLDYREISAPDGNQVSHILSLPNLEEVDEIAALAIREALNHTLAGRGEAVGPWD